MICCYETQPNMWTSEILLRNIDEKINIIVEKDHQFSFNSFVRRYHAYMDIWTPNVGDENLYVAVIIYGKTGGHIPKNLWKTFKRFLTLPNCTIKCSVIGKCVNHGASYGLNITADFKFLSQSNSKQKTL